MSFNVKPYAELLAMTKEKLDSALAPIRARGAKAKANLELSKIEEQMIDLETKINNACAEKELDFDKIIKTIDAYDLLERRQKQVKKLVEELFPEA